MQTSAQNLKFDSLANEVNRMSFYKKEKSLELLDNLYKIAQNDADSVLLVARCIYEESVLKYRQSIIDTMMRGKILKKMEIWNYTM